MNDGGPAFPTHGSMGEVATCGMTLRDYFAAKAMQGMIASDQTIDRTTVDKRIWAKVAYEFADAMLAERDKK